MLKLLLSQIILKHTFQFWPALIAAGGSIAGGLMANAANAKEGRLNRRHQGDMFKRAVDVQNTSHQREMVDLKKAGLNPILSGMGGQGSGSPQPSSGSQTAAMKDPFGPGINSAMATKQANSQIKLQDEQKRQTNQGTKLAMAQNAKTQAETKNLRANTKRVQAEADTALAIKNQTQSSSALEIRRNDAAQKMFLLDEANKRLPSISTPFGSFAPARKNRSTYKHSPRSSKFLKHHDSMRKR